MSSPAPSWSSPPRPGITRTPEGRTVDASRGALLRQLDASLRKLGTDYVDLWYVHYVDDAVPFEETLAALDAAVAAGQGPLRRRVELLRLADRPGGDLAARGARPRADRGQPGAVLARRPRRRARGRAGLRGARRRHLPVVAARRRRADRQVPRRDAVGLAGGGRAPAGPRVARPARARAGSSRRSRPRPRGSPRRRSPSRWPGCATGPGVVAPILGARTLGQLTGALACESRRAAARDPRRARRRLSAADRLPRGRALTALSRPAPTRSSPPSAPPGCGRASASGWPPSCPTPASHGPDDVTAAGAAALPKVGPQRAGRLLSASSPPQPSYEVVELVVPAGLDARVAGPGGGPARAAGAAAAARRPVAAARRDRRDAGRRRPGGARGASRACAATTPARPRALVGWVLARTPATGHTRAARASDVAAPLAEFGVGDPQAAIAAARRGRRSCTSRRRRHCSRWPATPRPRTAVAEGVARLLATAEPIEVAAGARPVGRWTDTSSERGRRPRCAAASAC